MQSSKYMSTLSQTDKVVMANHIVRLVKLIPRYIVELEWPANGAPVDIGSSIVASQINQLKQDLYLKVYDIAFSLVSQYQGDRDQLVEATVDVVEIVKRRLDNLNMES